METIWVKSKFGNTIQIIVNVDLSYINYVTCEITINRHVLILKEQK